jgi:hypothetical protein
MMSDYKYIEIVYDGKENFIDGRDYREILEDKHKVVKPIHIHSMEEK